MKIGCKYECKILLFGLAYDLSEVNEESCIICEIIGWDLSIGNLKVLQVENNGNIYYVAMDDVKNIKNITQHRTKILQNSGKSGIIMTCTKLRTQNG